MSRTKDPRAAYVLSIVERLKHDQSMLGSIILNGVEFGMKTWTQKRALAVFKALVENCPESELDLLVEASWKAMKDSMETRAQLTAEQAREKEAIQ